MTYDLTGKVFSRLTVLNKNENFGGLGKELRWDCLCVCGKQTTVRSYCLRKGHTTSCGCYGLEQLDSKANKKHGQWQSRTYHTWEGMKQRCLNPNATRYPEYGAVGITVCDRWLDFQNFYEDMGDRPIGKTLDRKNPFGNYEKDNCRWATPLEQQHNQRRHYVTEEVTPPCW